MPLAPEFQRKQQLEAKQFHMRENPQKGPKEHPEDTMIVRNILMGDDTEVEEVIPYANSRPSVDPSTGAQHFVNQIESKTFDHYWSTKDFFEVRWDGRPHRIKPGETRNMPRYLADHFAKHLIDFMLAQREEREDLKGLVKNRRERQKLLDQIIVGVASSYNGDSWDFEREGNYVEDQVNRMNQGPDNSIDLGEVPNPALGYGLSDKEPERNVHLENEQPSLTTPLIPGAPAMTREQIIDSKSKNMLKAEAEVLGIELKGSENKEQIYTAIEHFAGA